MSKPNKKMELTQIALELSEVSGYRNVTRESIAERAGIATGTVSLHMGTMNQLRRTIIRHALKEGKNRIIAEAIIADDPHVKRLTKEERHAALASVA